MFVYVANYSAVPTRINVVSYRTKDRPTRAFNRPNNNDRMVPPEKIYKQNSGRVKASIWGSICAPLWLCACLIPSTLYVAVINIHRVPEKSKPLSFSILLRHLLSYFWTREGSQIAITVVKRWCCYPFSKKSLRLC